MRIYGKWAGNERGKPEDTTRCVVAVSTGYIFRQCSRKRGHGPDGLYCRQHGKLADEGTPLYVPKVEAP